MRSVIVFSICLSAACGGRQRGEQAAHPGLAQAAGQDPAAAVAGAWALRALNRERVGQMLQLTLDSTNGRAFRTRVTFLMQGDVGIDPAQFTPTPGSVTADGGIRIEVRNTRGAPPGVILGRVAGDTIHVVEFSWGGENQLAGGTRWILVRER
jgi:hypothetical protein